MGRNAGQRLQSLCLPFDEMRRYHSIVVAWGRHLLT